MSTWPSDIVESVRNAADSSPTTTFYTHWSTTGEGEKVPGSGRAHCRSCGQKISKGTPSLKVFMDRGSGTYTAVWEQIHADECPG